MLFALHHVLVVTNVLTDIYSSRNEMLQTVAEHASTILPSDKLNSTLIPLSDGRHAIVSPQDYERISSLKANWKVSSSGYPIFVKRVQSKSKTVYMHRLIVPTPSRHLNGNRLDNRRENLVPSFRNTPRNDDFLSSLPANEAPEFDYKSSKLCETNGVVKVTYEDGRVYQGSVKQGIPHGYGELTAEHVKTIGEWADGIVKNGLNLYFRHTQVYRVEVITNNTISGEPPVDG